MKNLVLLAVFAVIAIWGTVAQAMDKVVYGTDGRKEVFESPTQYGEFARATAGMIPNEFLVQKGDKFELAGVSTLKRDYSLCDSEKFLTQPTAANCSGFLVAPDTLVTAGHCITNQADCAGSAWVFDYKLDNADKVRTSFPKSDVYKCKSIVARDLSRTTMNDFAIITLDRAVTGRQPLKVRTTGKVEQSADLLVIGQPSGLPTKITEGGTLRNNNNSVYFVANLDTFAGNSGSVVLDAKTGLVEGILVRGENDYVLDSARRCNIVNVCAEGKCRGEDVTRITNLAKFLKPRKR